LANPALPNIKESLSSKSEAKQLPERHLLKRLPTFAAAATLAMLLAMTLATAITIRSVNSARSDDRFDELIHSVSTELGSEFQKSLSELAAIKGFLEATDSVTRTQFNTFAGALEKENWSLQALGYVKKVEPDEVESFNRLMSEQLFESYDLESKGKHSNYYPVAFTYPESLGILNPGEDLSQHPRYMPLMIQAEADRRLIPSAPVPSASNPHDQAAVVVFTPIFDANGNDSGEIRGYGTGVYRVADFLAGPVERSGLGEVEFRVVALDEKGVGQEIFPIPNGETDQTWDRGISRTSNLDFEGRIWQLQFSKPVGFGLTELESRLWMIVLAGGMIITGLATVSMYSLISSRQTAQSDLSLMTNRMNTLLDSAKEAILLVGSDDTVVWANQAYTSAFGFMNPESLVGQTWEHARVGAGVKFENRRKYLGRLRQINKNHGLSVTAEDVHITGPEKRILSLTSSPSTNDENEYLGRLWVFRDVTQERAVDRSKNEFVSMVSHELRTPLTSMTGFIELVLDGAGGDINQNTQRLLDKAYSNGMRLNRLVSDLLDISRLESGNLALELGEVSIQSLLMELTEAMTPQFEEKQLKLKVKLPDKLRAAWADRERCAQIFNNLLTNAVRYTPEQGSVTVKAKTVGDTLEVAVVDTGLGIGTEHQARIFDKFVRLSSNGKRPAGSTGLGLAITKSLVEAQGGSIRLESTPGEGSTFTVSLPLAERPE